MEQKLFRTLRAFKSSKIHNLDNYEPLALLNVRFLLLLIYAECLDIPIQVRQ